jgi:hypothetical protein
MSEGRTRGAPAPSRFVHDHALSIAATGIFLATWLGAAIVGWYEFVAEARAHDQTPHVFGSDGYAWVFAEQTFQNWQSEFLAVGLLIALASVLIHRGSQQSRDSLEERRERVLAISRRVDGVSRRRKED